MFEEQNFLFEVHAGVDIDYSYISTRGGIAVRWESDDDGQSTRQRATQVIGYDCNTPILMSAYDNTQVELAASYVKAIGCDNGVRAMTTGGDTKRSTVSNIEIYGGRAAQVILCRFATCDSKYGSVKYNDDAWTPKQSEAAVDLENNRSTSSITVSKVRCTAAATFSEPNVGFGSCGGL